MQRGYAAPRRMQHVAILTTPAVIYAHRKVSLSPAFSVRVRDDIVTGSWQISRPGVISAQNTIRQENGPVRFGRPFKQAIKMFAELGSRPLNGRLLL